MHLSHFPNIRFNFQRATFFFPDNILHSTHSFSLFFFRQERDNTVDLLLTYFSNTPRIFQHRRQSGHFWEGRYGKNLCSLYRVYSSFSSGGSGSGIQWVTPIEVTTSKKNRPAVIKFLTQLYLGANIITHVPSGGGFSLTLIHFIFSLRLFPLNNDPFFFEIIKSGEETSY